MEGAGNEERCDRDEIMNGAARVRRREQAADDRFTCHGVPQPHVDPSQPMTREPEVEAVVTV